ncbi:MAG: hypothetical protein WA865_03480 [Spirulinaceae cyanobacterium]
MTLTTASLIHTKKDKKMIPDTPEATEFQNWLWGSLEPRQFSVRYAPVNYPTIALLAGVSEETVRHWMQNPQLKSYRQPSPTAMNLLALAAWWLDTFDLTPDELMEIFEQER